MEDLHLKKIKRCLISVWDKNHLKTLAQLLHQHGVEILSSGGTYTFLTELGIPSQTVESFTGAPEMLEGRLKTLHPKIYGGLLSKRQDPLHQTQMKTHDYCDIDLVVVNLYPFEATLQNNPNADQKTKIEKIDIGGPTLLRAGAKNFEDVCVLSDPSHYALFEKEFLNHKGSTTKTFREDMALAVFAHTAHYDAHIAMHLKTPISPTALPQKLFLELNQKAPLRYGENPHQHGAFYVPAHTPQKHFVMDGLLQGKELSYNNLLDIHRALNLVLEWGTSEQVCGIFKHNNPCGVGVSDVSLREAYERALSCDPISAFGGVVVFSHELDALTAAALMETFTEVVLAPTVSNEAKRLFEKKKNLRLIEWKKSMAEFQKFPHALTVALEGVLVQTWDETSLDLSKASCVTHQKPNPTEQKALALAWKVAKHVKSNAIVLASSTQTLGIGAGQMSRVDASLLAKSKMNPALTPDVIVLASDAFFPFRDGIDQAFGAKVTAVVQPGGSIKDDEVIAAANEHHMAMLFTNQRHFLH